MFIVGSHKCRYLGTDKERYKIERPMIDRGDIEVLISDEIHSALVKKVHPKVDKDASAFFMCSSKTTSLQLVSRQ